MTMPPDQVGELREVERWLRESRAEAERLLPGLLDLSEPLLSRELEQRPDLRPGLIPLLLAVAQEALERDPARAHALTSAVVAHAQIDVPPPRAAVARNLQGQAWTVHASALRGIGRHDEARRAIAVAIDVYREGLVSAWHIATAEVVEAQILHDQGQCAEALRRIRHAAEDLLLHGDRERYFQARMTEAWMHSDAGDLTAAAEVWRNMGEEAMQRGDRVLLALMENRLGAFELRHGSAEEAARHFAAVHPVLDAAGIACEGIRALRGLAEAAFARGRFHEAISEYYKVQAVLLAEGGVIDAAVVSAEILALLLAVGRENEVLPLVELLVARFAEAGLAWNAMQAWTFVRQRARAGVLTRESIATVRRYFEDLPLQPNARFLAQEPG